MRRDKARFSLTTREINKARESHYHYHRNVDLFLTYYGFNTIRKQENANAFKVSLFGSKYMRDVS